MKQPDLKHEDMSRFGADIRPDPEGRLYSPHIRQLFASLNVDLSAIEALSALRFAARSISLLQDRWAEKHGLTEGRLGVLFRLYRAGEAPLGDLAHNLDSSPRNITGLVDHLERDGLVERVPDPDDRRSVRARLTAAGRARIEAIWKEGIGRQFEVAGGLSREDLVLLRHVCLQLVLNAKKELGK